MAGYSTFQHLKQKYKYLQFQAQQINCCVALDSVHKAFSLMALTPVPKAPDYLAGVFNYRGFTVPVLDLAMRLGQPVCEPYSIYTNVLICNTLDSGSFLGLILDSIGKVLEISSAELQLAPQFPGKSSPFSAIYQTAQNTCFVLNTEALLNSSLTLLYTVTPAEIAEFLTSGLDFSD